MNDAIEVIGTKSKVYPSSIWRNNKIEFTSISQRAKLTSPTQRLFAKKYNSI